MPSLTTSFKCFLTWRCFSFYASATMAIANKQIGLHIITQVLSYLNFKTANAHDFKNVMQWI